VTHQVIYPRLLPVCLLLCLAFASTASARESHDRTQVGGNITVGPGEEVGDATLAAVFESAAMFPAT
jgi:hypothetical protein